GLGGGTTTAGGLVALGMTVGAASSASREAGPTFEQVLNRFPPGWKERFGEWCAVGGSQLRGEARDDWGYATELEAYLSVQYSSSGKTDNKLKPLQHLLSVLRPRQYFADGTHLRCSWLLRNALMADPVLGGYGDSGSSSSITSKRLDLRAAIFDVKHVEPSYRFPIVVDFQNLFKDLRQRSKRQRDQDRQVPQHSFQPFLPEFAFWADVDDTLVCSHAKTGGVPGTDQSLTKESEKTLSANEIENHTHRVYLNFPLLLKFLNIETAMRALYLPGNGSSRGKYTFADVDPRNVEVVRVEENNSAGGRVSRDGASTFVSVYNKEKRLPWYPGLLTARPGRLTSGLGNGRQSAASRVGKVREKVMVTRSHFPAVAYHVRIPRGESVGKRESFGRGPLMILPGADRAGALFGATFGETGIRRTNQAAYQAYNPQAACTLAGNRKFDVL
ncbi:unnamed protein product, partial [Amoebophrya sp. A120]